MIFRFLAWEIGCLEMRLIENTRRKKEQQTDKFSLKMLSHIYHMFLESQAGE